MPKPEDTFNQLAHAQCPSWLRTRGRKNHKSNLRGHVLEIGHFDSTPLPISIPFDKIPKNNLN